ncbi:MAG: hypothetical protein JKX69_09145 [Rhodobacteraceae bacterium]|nr:hypothetical protein [Paracoccaceae bacterium]
MNQNTAQKKPAKRARGALAVIAGLLVASGLIRLGEGAGAAWASGAAAQHDEADMAQPASCEAGLPTGELLEAFRQREERVATREALLTDRMQALRLAEAEINEKLAALTLAEESLLATLALASAAADDDIMRLTAVYENMKPVDAAALFEEMPPDFAAGFIARMRSDAAAAVMTNLEPITAYSVSVVIAGRNANVPTQ